MGTLSVTALGKPNALLLIGPEATVEMIVKNLIEPLDKPIPVQSRFEVFQLKNINATNAATTINTFLGQGTTGPTTPLAVPDVGVPGLAPRALVVAETSTNSLIVVGSAQDIALVAELLRRLDTPTNVAASLKVFQIRNGDASASG